MSETAQLAAGEDTAPLRTERLVLRSLRADDSAPLFAIINNWRVIRMLTQPPWPYALEDAEGYIGRCLRAGREDEQVRAITLAGDFIGCIGFRDAKAGPRQSGDGPHIGYWLGEPFWGRGYMSEALRAVAGDLFARRPLTAIYSGVIADNGASLRVLEKVGFVRDGDGQLTSRPRGETVPYIAAILTRAAFARELQA